MRQIIGTIVILEQYQCQRCGRFFYINKDDKSDYDMEKYDCPYGCVGKVSYDKTRLARRFTVKIEKVKEL